MKPNRTRMLALATLTVTLSGASLGAGDRALGHIGVLHDLADVGRLRDWRVGQSSGYDTLLPNGLPGRTPPRNAKGRYVLFDVKGHGCVTRIWGSGLTGNLMVWIDDDTEPRFQGPWDKLAYSWWTYRTRVWGNKPELPYVCPLLCPLSDASRGSQVVMVPMGFTKRCTIAMDRAPAGNQYHVDYVLAPGASVAPFDPKSLSPDRPPLKDVLAVWRDPGNVFASDPTWHRHSGTADLKSGEAMVLLAQTGAGQVRLLSVELPFRNPRAARALLLRATWDGGPDALLELPLADLCAMGFGNGNPNVPAGVEGIPPNGRRTDLLRLYCRLPMPFGRGARLTLVNKSPWPTFGIRWQVAWQALPAGAPGYGRLCGFTRRLEPARDAKAIDLVDLRRGGHLVGYTMSFWDVDEKAGPGRWFAEAVLDGEPKPRLQGAPFFDFNWGPRAYWHPGPVAAVCGTTQHEYPGGVHGRHRVAFYRYMIADVARFAKSCTVRLRRADAPGHFGHADMTWLFYLEPGARRTWPKLNPADLPWPTTRSPGAIEAESLGATATVTGGTLSRVRDRWGAHQFSDGSMLVYAPERPGDVLGLRIPAPEVGYYHLDIRQIGGPSFSTYRLQRHGKRFAQPLPGVDRCPGVVVRYDPTTYGTWYLQKGDNRFEFVFTPDNWHTGVLLGLDCFWLRPVSKRTNLAEAEYLPVVRRHHCAVAPEPLGNPRASAWGALAIEPTREGASVVLGLPVKSARQATTLLVGYHAEPGAGLELVWDGKPLGQVVVDKQTVPFYRRVAAFPMTRVAKGDHQVTLRLRSQQALSLDFLKLSDAQRFEAEALPVYTKSMAPRVSPGRPRPNDPTSLQNVVLRQATVTKERPLLVGVPVLRAGTYDLAVWLVPDGATCGFRFGMNGKPLGQPVTVARKSARPAPVPLGSVSLVKGQNILSITSTAWFRLDAIDVTRSD